MSRRERLERLLTMHEKQSDCRPGTSSDNEIRDCLSPQGNELTVQFETRVRDVQSAVRYLSAPREKPIGLLERVSHRFLQYPFLHFVFMDTRWTAVVFLMLLVGFVSAVSVLKIWVRTPSGFRPIVRVSLFDIAQAWALKQTAQRAEKRGDTMAALNAWISAAGQDFANVALLRSALAAAARVDHLPSSEASKVLAQIPWLLRLSQTNEIDVQIAVELLRKHNRWLEIEELLRPRLPNLTPEEQKNYVSSLFWLGRIDEFARAWEQFPVRLSNDPAIQLCHSAYMAAWGSPEQAAAGRRFMAAALENPDLEIEAHRANLVVASALLDALSYEKSLRRLEEARAANLYDAVGYWRLLVKVGRADEARKLAQNYLYPPRTAWEVLDQAIAYLDLGLQDLACQFMRRYVPQFGRASAGWSIAMWIVYGELLMDLRRWDELLDMTLTVGRIPEAIVTLRGYTSFLEGRAYLAQGAVELAADRFEYAAKQDFFMPEIGFEVGISLLQLGYPDLARKVLVKLERDLSENALFWQALLEAAVVLKNDSVEFFKAAREAYRLSPGEVQCINNYAAALLVNRWQPDEAVRLTYELILREPKLLQARINHAFGLAQCRRFNEAFDVLCTIDPTQLAETHRTAYYLASAEINLNLGRFESARLDLARIDESQLFPNQRRWVETMKRKLPALRSR